MMPYAYDFSKCDFLRKVANHILGEDSGMTAADMADRLQSLADEDEFDSGCDWQGNTIE